MRNEIARDPLVTEDVRPIQRFVCVEDRVEIRAEPDRAAEPILVRGDGLRAACRTSTISGKTGSGLTCRAIDTALASVALFDSRIPRRLSPARFRMKSVPPFASRSSYSTTLVQSRA